MSRLHTSFVLGYHGCTKATGEGILAGRFRLKSSENSYDWLGPGMYFWEADPVRAMEWAYGKVRRDGEGEPFVVGAVIDLGNCLDLMAREDLAHVRQAYEGLKAAHEAAELGPLPENAPVGSADGDNLLRHLDCATIRHLHAAVKADQELEPFDTVRGLFTEGGKLYPGSGFFAKTHVQIAVRTLGNIKGFFRV